ncbi:Mov34/MPN/PAD-1 family protein [Paenibacillus aestuarii]|uniref:Mov34/MPN/PAD-1 family protein n=1 Tax=Paenibacillus aestuarii TaxID=516965 RepID=A0ABW0KE57_9BACL|nr:Mov34/MPN/PAD-1 family protein [Paenibacillus aestuarii]
MTIYLPSALFHELTVYSRKHMPHEACGFITGSFNGKTEIQADRFISIRNSSSNPARHFTMNPTDLIPVLTDPSLHVIGIFHSHPDAPPIPSFQDLNTEWHTTPSHWILSLLFPEAPSLHIYEIKKAPLTAYRKLPFVICQ